MIKNLIDKAEAAYTRAQDLVTKSGGSPSDELSRQIDALYQEADTAMEQVRTLEERDELGRDIEAALERANRPANERLTAESPEAAERAIPAIITPENCRDVAALSAYREKFVNSLIRQKNGQAIHDPVFAQVTRAMSVGTDAVGGYLVPEEWAAEIIRKRRERNFMRQICTVGTKGAGTRHIPVGDDDGVATYGAEASAYSEDDESFSEITVDDHKCKRLVKVSEELLADADYDVEGYIETRCAESMADIEEEKFIAGSGSGEPRGFITDVTQNITAAGATTVTALELIDLEFAVGRAYRSDASYIMQDATLKIVRKLVDGDGRPLWQPSLQASDPSTLNGYPVYTSAYVPAATTGLESIFFGAFKYHHIFDRTGINMQRLDELYAANGQVGFRFYARNDSALTVPAAIAKLTQA